MTWRTLALLGILALLALTLLPARAQETAPAEAPTTQATPPEPQPPSRDNNFNMPNVIHFDGEAATEGFYFFFLCGKPVIAIYDNDHQMAVPLFGPALLQTYRQQAWELEDGPPAMVLPDLASIYAPLSFLCEDLAAYDRKIKRDNEKIAPSAPTKMK